MESKWENERVRVTRIENKTNFDEIPHRHRQIVATGFSLVSTLCSLHTKGIYNVCYTRRVPSTRKGTTMPRSYPDVCRLSTKLTIIFALGLAGRAPPSRERERRCVWEKSSPVVCIVVERVKTMCVYVCVVCIETFCERRVSAVGMHPVELAPFRTPFLFPQLRI